MPEEAHRDRQLEAMRRYVAELAVERGRPPAGGQPGAGRPRPSLPWLALTASLVIVALLGGVLIGQARRPDQRGSAGTSRGAASATSRPLLAGPVATPECRTAVDRANKALAVAERTEAALREYTRIMDDLRDGKLDGRQAVEQATPSLAIGTIAAAQFESALADYNKVVDRCQLQAP
jgi:hypothetical protein